MNRRTVWIFATLGASLLGASCSGGGGGGGTDTDPPPGTGQTREIHLTEGLAFSPGDIVIDRGTRVRWINDAAIPHTITPENTQQPGAWAAATVSAAGQTVEHTFNTAGVFYYRCQPHHGQGMTGIIRVKDDEGGGIYE